jgi:hypothetical protein
LCRKLLLGRIGPLLLHHRAGHHQDGDGTEPDQHRHVPPAGRPDGPLRTAALGGDPVERAGCGVPPRDARGAHRLAGRALGTLRVQRVHRAPPAHKSKAANNGLIADCAGYRRIRYGTKEISSV